MNLVPDLSLSQQHTLTRSDTDLHCLFGKQEEDRQVQEDFNKLNQGLDN